MNGKIILLTGYPSSGKTTYSKKFVDNGFYRLSRDELGGKLDDLVKHLSEYYKEKNITKFIMDATYTTASSRKQVLIWAQENNFSIECRWLTTDIGNSFYNAAKRIIDKKGRLLMPDEIKKQNDPNIYPPIVIYRYRKTFEEPSIFEGFSVIKRVNFTRKLDLKLYRNKAIILDYDGTLRTTISGKKYPQIPEDIKVLPKRKEVLSKYQDLGYFLLGVSNQSGVGKGTISNDQAVRCFEKTNELLDLEIDYKFCPHSTFPINCYCRKPMPGLAIDFIEKYKLNPSQCIMVGDQKTDLTFAERCGFNFIESSDFFE